jgi:predicted DNA-binding transcriptional regulator AlpA
VERDDLQLAQQRLRARVMNPVRHTQPVRRDITERLSGDGLTMTVGALLQERAEALSEITRLRHNLAGTESTVRPKVSTGLPPHDGALVGLQLEPGSMLRLRDICTVFSLSRSSVYTWIDEGRFPPPVHIGGRSVRWPAEALVEWRQGLGCSASGGANSPRGRVRATSSRK